MTPYSQDELELRFVDLGVDDHGNLVGRMIIRCGNDELPHLYRDRVDFYACVHHLAAAAHAFATAGGSSYRFIANEYSEPRIELVKSGASVFLSATDEWASPYEGWALRVLAMDDFLSAWAGFKADLSESVRTRFPASLPQLQAMLAVDAK